jgi:hypothetical protein
MWITPPVSGILQHMERARPCGRDPNPRMLIAAAVLLTASGANAAPRAADPDWPCQQIKVPEVSIAAVWSGPEIDPNGHDWRGDPAVTDLVQRIAPRREPIEQAELLIRDFARGAGDRRNARLQDLLVGLFATLGDERASVIAGLDRFGQRQKELALQVRSDNEKLRALQADPAADPALVAQATQQVTWDVEVFQDRRQAISAACAVPGKIEQRLFALARSIQDALD